MKAKRFLTAFLTALALIVSVMVIAPLAASAQEPQVTEVKTWNELLNAVNSDKTSIKLTDNVAGVATDEEIPSKYRLQFNGGKEYSLDLNGFKLSVDNSVNEYYGGTIPMIAVTNTSTLNVKNGRIRFYNAYASERTAEGVIFVGDDSTINATRVHTYNDYTGTVLHAVDNASVTLDGGEYEALNGFAIALDGQASLTLDGGVTAGTRVGDSAATVFVDGYGALHSKSTGTLTINNARFNTGVQVHESQIGAFDAATHELTINGLAQTEDVYFSDAGNQFSALDAGKTYYWYKNGYFRCLYRVDTTLFSNDVSVISKTKKYSLEVESGIAKVAGSPVSEASYGQTVTLVADAPEAGMEFLRWDTNGVLLDNYYTETTTFTMPAAPVYVAAYYGKEAVKSVSITSGEVVAGKKAYDTEITVNGATLSSVEWILENSVLEENDIFRPGNTYQLKALIHPNAGDKLSDTLTATVNGNNATVSANASYAYVTYSYELPAVSFSAVYNNSTAKLGIGGIIELDTALMAGQSAEFKSALDAGKVTYQWYKDGEAIEGATVAIYEFDADDVGSRFYVSVTADGKTAYTHGVKCHNSIYNIYLNANETIIGGKAPALTSVTPGVGIDYESIYITEGHGQPAMDITTTVLVPGKTYYLVGELVQLGEEYIPYGASVIVNDVLMDDAVDGLGRFFYKFTVPAADFPVYYTANGDVGVGATISVDVDRMRNENATFNHACEAANPTYQTVFYQWYKNGEAINGATNASYTVKKTDKNSFIHCKVTLVDGKFGVGTQHAITNVITVISVNMPYPKHGDGRMTSGITSVEVTIGGMMWLPESTGNVMQSGDTYVEGEEYGYLMKLAYEDGFTFADSTRIKVYVNGQAVMFASTYAEGYQVSGTIVAVHKHIYGNKYNHDEYGHWLACTIIGCTCPDEEELEYSYHYGTEATCQKEGECTVCGAKYYADHEYGVYVYVDDRICGRACIYEGCTVTVDWSYHEGGTFDCSHKSVCDICHEEYGLFGDHAADGVWKKDEDKHWQKCTICDEAVEESAHADGDGDGKCDACAHEMPVPDETPDNTPDNTPEDIPEDKPEGLSGGAIAGIVVGGVVVLGFGGFAIFWFVIKKKSLADLLAIFKKK